MITPAVGFSILMVSHLEKAYFPKKYKNSKNLHLCCFLYCSKSIALQLFLYKDSVWDKNVISY
ncbi:hypothetical protein J2T04_004036 [Chryseobacterium lathyri]|uniref:Uncharacterized protein n=1 Tax=Chryseobacterium lathyri TaxID=395933 RepID=A0ABT9SRN2_9FLAO|nr:hypothetical protein [Chryseobacterium lathyri]